MRRQVLWSAVRRLHQGVLAVVLAVAGLAVAAPPSSAHVPHDDIVQVVFSPDFATDRTVFAISRNRLMRSTNSGASWHQIVNGIDRHKPARIAVAPRDKQIMYLSNLGSGVHRSQDQGWSWTPTNGPASMREVADIAVSPVSPNTVFAAPTTTGLFKTTNGGQDWTPVGSFGRITAIAFVNTGRIVVGDSNGAVHYSDNDGATWATSPGTASGNPVTAIATTPAGTSPRLFVGTRGGRVYRSTNNGASFTAVGAGVPSEPVTSIAMSPTYPVDTTVWLTTWDSGAYQSTNAGGTFVKRSTGLTTDRQNVEEGEPQFGSVAYAKAGDGSPALFVGGFDGLFKFDQSASRWREVQTLVEYITSLAVSPNYAEDGTVIATTYVKGAYLSTNGGTTWAGRHVGLGRMGANDYTAMERLFNVQFSPNYENDGMIFSGTWRNLLRSTDRGASWVSYPLGSSLDGEQRQFVFAPSPSFATDKTIYVGTRQGDVYRSTSRGDPNTWKWVSNAGSRVRSLVLSPTFATDKTVYAGAFNGVRKSIDGGVTWQATGPASISLLAISRNYAADGTVFAGTESGLYVTRNKGGTWTELTAEPLSATSHVEAVGVSPAYASDRTVLVSVLNKGLYKSTDGGASFVAVGANLFADNVLIGDFDNPSSAPIQFSPTFAQDHTVFGFAQDRVVRSSDGGNTWTVLNLPPANLLIKPPAIAPAPGTPSAVEGNSGTRVMRVPIDVSHPYRLDVTVQWQTVDGGGTPGLASSSAGDFTPAAGTLVFPAGETRRYIDVVVNGDSLDEDDESVIVSMRNPTNATIGSPYGLGFGVIRDDDPLPAVLPGAASVVEGDSGTTVLTIPMTLSASSGRTVTVDWQTVDYDAVGGQDYLPASGTLTFLPGQRTQLVTVTVIADTENEADEALLVATSNPTNAKLGGFYGLGVGTISNDDP